MRAMVVALVAVVGVGVVGGGCASEQAELCQDQCERGAWQDYPDEAACEHVCRTDCADGEVWGVTQLGLPCLGIDPDCPLACYWLDQCGWSIESCVSTCTDGGWAACVNDTPNCSTTIECTWTEGG